MMDNTNNDKIVESCKASGEPYFVLRAQDCLASTLVAEWAIRAEGAGAPADKVARARLASRVMRLWLVKKVPD